MDFSDSFYCQFSFSCLNAIFLHDIPFKVSVLNSTPIDVLHWYLIGRHYNTDMHACTYAELDLECTLSNIHYAS